MCDEDADTQRLPGRIHTDNRLKVRIRHGRLVPQVLFGSGTESLHCGRKHWEALGDAAAEACPIEMTNKLFPAEESTRFTNVYPSKPDLSNSSTTCSMLYCKGMCLTVIVTVGTTAEVVKESSRRGGGVFVVPNFCPGWGRSFLARSSASPC